MEDRIAFAKEQVGSLIRAALNRAMETGALPQADLPEFVVEIPADKANGDVAVRRWRGQGCSAAAPR